MPLRIETARLTLIELSAAEALAQLEAMSEADRAQVSPDWIKRLESPFLDFWTLGFSIHDRANQAAIGRCGYKGPPDERGVVEIAYGIDPAAQGKGYASEAAEAMTRFAFSTGKVRAVRAHTLPQSNASGRVLTKCGFIKTGEMIDPEDGLVWRWERSGSK